jgi:hypothetical protein
MKRIFEYIGGIPIRLRFDNMTTAVAQVLKDGERVLTDGFTRFMLHCIFRADFCNPASGKEEGNVEKKVGYSRRNASASVPSLPRLRNLINGFGSGTKRTPTGSTTNTRFPRLLSQELAVIYGLETYGPDPAGQVQSTLAQQKGVTTPGYGTHLNGRSRLSSTTFFRDDDLEQMTFSGTGRRGETGITILRISAFQEVGDYDLAPAFPPAILLYIKIVSLIFICYLATIILF